MTNPLDKILRPVKDKIVRAVSAPYSPKVLESTTARFADIISKENPKLTDIEVLKKATTQATKKLEWERVQKPYLEKKYGALAKASYVDSNPAKMQNVAEVVEARKRKANEFLDQPTESWKPPRKELQAFDRAAIKDALEGFPDVEQSAFPRDVPTRASTAHVEELYGDPENRALIEKQIKRGLPLGGETFYASLYPLKLAVMEAGMPAEKFDKWVHSIAPASARNSIMNEMAAGQLLRNMNARGIPLTEENVTREMAAFKEKFGISVPLMPVHRQGVQNVIEGGQNLRDMSIANIPTNYKIPTYGSQKAGDFAKSIVLDVHEAAGLSQGIRFHPYFKEQGGFGNTEYGVGEKGLLGMAEDMGLPGGMAQAGRWFGGGELTGLKSPRGDALDLLEKQVAYTLKQKGVQPNPANVREEILRQIETGEGDLLPWYRKEGMPDVRETGLQRAEGGAVSQDAMNLSVMNQKVQRKMGGGGAKSKNAPKFTEAFTQGLGPMLYGAARGTAAGLAGIGGDIEELARLGINYAGDKLQGRFPNMLDKKDVVSPKATLPTSGLVLSKIPSLKDFGAGPEARHSEDIAAKLGMYGLTNIAAPKVGKAVVQGVNATGKALAPKAGEMLENYMVRTGGILPMDTWHGSPHRFPPTAKNPLGEFDASKIGTGEGAQAYGHGLYFAEAPATARTYSADRAYVGAAMQGKPSTINFDDPAWLAQKTIDELGDISKATSHLKMVQRTAAKQQSPETKAQVQAAIDLLESGNIATKGNLYKVDLPDEQIAKMLDWDKAVEGDIASRLVRSVENTKGMNPDDFKDALGLSRMYEGQPESGSSIYRLIAGSLGSDAKASKWLKESGIPGIRYLDQGSRPNTNSIARIQANLDKAIARLEDWQGNTSSLGESQRKMFSEQVASFRKILQDAQNNPATSNFVVFPGNEEMLNILRREKDGGLVHGKKNGGEVKKPFSNDFENKLSAAGSSLFPSQKEMEDALRPATVNSLLARAADRRQGKAMQEEPKRPEIQEEATVKPYNPTFRQNRAAEIQRLLQDADSPKPRARSLAESIMGVGGTGIADFVPYLGTGMAWQEGIRNIQEANRRGDTAGALGEAALMSAMTAIGVGPALKLANHLAGKVKSNKVRMSEAEYKRILRENEPKQLSAPELQRLLNAPAREKTVFEMQQEIAQKNAMLPKSQYGLELPPGNTAAQRLEAMGIKTDAYHGSKHDITGAFKPGYDDNLAFVTPYPDFANNWIGKGKLQKRLGKESEAELKLAEDEYSALKYKKMDYGSLNELKGDAFHAEYDKRNDAFKKAFQEDVGLYPDKTHNTVYPLKVKANKTFNPETDIDVMSEFFKENNTLPQLQEFFKSGNYLVYETKPVVNYLKSKGYDSMRLRESTGDNYPTIALFEPESVRSPFAAGDPFRRNAAIAAATGSVAPDLLAEEYANGGVVTSDDLILIERRR